MIQEILKGYSSLDNCYKFRNQDSTISCYTYSRGALNNKVVTADPELNTNSIYLLIGSEDNKQKVYVGKAKVGADGTSALRRINQHLSNQARLKEKYFDHWQQAIIFVCNNVDRDTKWTTTDIDDLEALLIKDTVPGYSWNSKKETESKDISSGLARSYSRKLLDIKEYVSELGYHFFDDVEDVTYNAKLEAEEKKLIDKTVSLKTINLEPFAKVPEYTTPESVVNNMLDLLPWDKFNSSTTFFDPACKGGEFLALIHDRLCEILQNDPMFNGYEGTEKTIRIHDHIIKNQLYGIAIGDNSYDTARKRVYDCENIVKVPAKYYIDDMKEFKKFTSDGKDIWARTMIKRRVGKDMKIDVVVGNPPYQDFSGRSSIYPSFMEWAASISDITTMITRDNWILGKDFERTRNHIITNGTVEKIYHYPVVGEVFDTLKVSVAYFLWKRDKYRKTEYNRIENGELKQSTEIDIQGAIISDTTNRIIDKVNLNHTWLDIFAPRSYPFMDQRKRYRLTTVDEPDEQHNVKIITNDGAKPKYTSLGSFSSEDEVSQYKVMCGVVINEASHGKPGNALTNIVVLNPMCVASESWSLVATFHSEEQAHNCAKYIKTRFIRFLANQTVNGRSNVTDNTFKYIPLQDFTSSSDIDWSKSISDIDQQLYRKYNLTQEEIDYIENTIKPMA